MAAAAAFIDRLPGPVLAVPRSHDIPGVTPARFADPWRGWLRHVPADMEPVVEGAGFLAVGANSVRSGGPYLDWSRGRLGEAQIAWPAARLERKNGGCVYWSPVNPLMLTPAGAHRGLLGRSELALARLHRAGLDLTHVGTGVSDRLVGERNGFNVITGDQAAPTVARRRWRGRAHAPDGSIRFERGEAGWRLIWG